jgi:hypothetical protein
MMTGNAGYNEALGWAVMHTMDPNFNHPIAILKPVKELRIDENAIQLLQESLVRVGRVLEDKSSRSALIHFIASQHQDKCIGQTHSYKAISGRGVTEPVRHIPSQVKNKVVSTRKAIAPTGGHQPPAALALPKKVVGGLRSIKPSAPPPLPKRESSGLVQKGETPATAVANSSSSPDDKRMHLSLSEQLPENIDLGTRVQQKVTSSAQPQTPAPLHLKPNELPPQITSAPAMPIGNQKSISSCSSNKIVTKIDPGKVLDRDELRKRGQAALDGLRNTSQTGSRRRLIEEGRQLLKQSMSNPKVLKGISAGVSTAGRATAPGINLTRLESNSRPQSSVLPKTTAEVSKVGNSTIGLSIPNQKPSRIPQKPTIAKILPPSRVAVRTATKIDSVNDSGEDGWDFDDF